MKRLLTILCLVLLSSCSQESEVSQEVIPEVETVTRNGLIYHQSSTEPFTGIVEGFHPNGRLSGRGNYVDGERDDLQELFYENGQLRRRYIYRDGKEDGLWEWFNQDGNLTDTVTF